MPSDTNRCVTCRLQLHCACRATCCGCYRALRDQFTARPTAHDALPLAPRTTTTLLHQRPHYTFCLPTCRLPPRAAAGRHHTVRGLTRTFALAVAQRRAPPAPTPPRRPYTHISPLERRGWTTHSTKHRHGPSPCHHTVRTYLLLRTAVYLYLVGLRSAFNSPPLTVAFFNAGSERSPVAGRVMVMLRTTLLARWTGYSCIRSFGFMTYTVRHKPRPAAQRHALFYATTPWLPAATQRSYAAVNRFASHTGWTNVFYRLHTFLNHWRCAFALPHTHALRCCLPTLPGRAATAPGAAYRRTRTCTCPPCRATYTCQRPPPFCYYRRYRDAASRATPCWLLPTPTTPSPPCPPHAVHAGAC